MAKIKWFKTRYPGVRFFKHSDRKHGVQFDKSFHIRFNGGGKLWQSSLGWSSGGMTAEKASLKLAEYKRNFKAGKRPWTLTMEKEDADREAQAQVDAAEEEEREAITFGAFFNKTYLPIAITHKKPDTMKEEKSVFKVWLSPYLGNIRLRDLRPLHFERIKRDMLKKKKAPRRVQYVLAISRQVWNTARNEGVVSGDWPGRGVKIPKIDNRRMRFLTPQESEDLLSELKSRSQQTHDITLISLDCGLRFGEIVKLQCGHVNIEGGIIMVVDPKGTKNRAAFMTTRVKEMFESMPTGNKTDLVFRDANGQPIKKISKTFSRAVDHLGLNDGVTDRRDRVVYHSARHTFASNLVSNGADLYVVSQLLGHADVTMAARYSHLGAGSLRAAVEAMEQAQTKATADVIPLQVNGKS
jgi:integrase